MATFRGRWCALLGVSLITATAGATPPPGAPPLRVTFSAPVERSQLTIHGHGIEPSGRSCSVSCTLELRPGTYTVHVASAGRTSELPVRVTHDSEVEVRPPSQSQRTAGIGLIITGSALVASGLVAFAYDTARKVAAVPRAYGGGGGGYSSPVWITPLEIAGGVGLLTALVGVGLLTTAHPTAVVHSQADAAHERRPRVPRKEVVFVAPGVVLGGAGLHLGWRF